MLPEELELAGAVREPPVNITKIVLGEIMVYDRELLKLKLQFVTAPKATPQHG